jgi:asparagine synthase (glutamine-hydrolysing)
MALNNKLNVSEDKLNLKEKIYKKFNLKTNTVDGYIDGLRYEVASSNGVFPFNFHSNNTWVIGDIELHNQQELSKKYRIKEGSSVEYIIGKLYQAKGISFVEELIGNFSFVLYDKDTNKTYAIRDQVGVKTLFWIRTNEELVLSSDIFLLKEYLKKETLNTEYFHEFYYRNGIIDSSLTPFQDIYRLSSGCFVQIDGSSERIKEYWDLANYQERIHYKNEDDYYEEFSHILKKSTESRLKKGSSNSIMLSGGLDSTSIYALSKQIQKQGNFKVTPVSAVFDELKECDEREYIKGLLKKYNDKGVFQNFDDLLMFQNFPKSIPFSDEPSVNSISYNFTKKIVEKSTQHGFNNILSGFAGDHLLTGSLHVTRDLLKEGKIKKALDIITNYSIVTNSSAFNNFIKYTIFPNIPKEHLKGNNGSYYSFIKDKLSGLKYDSQKELYYQITNAKSHLYTDRTIGGYTNADIQHPFLDRRLIEYVFKVPGNLRFTGRDTKYILRKSMKGSLTNEILSRVNKTTHLAYTYKSIRENWNEIYSIMKEPLISSEFNLVSPDAWKNELEKWRNGVQVSDQFWTIFSLELWLKQYMYHNN